MSTQAKWWGEAGGAPVRTANDIYAGSAGKISGRNVAVHQEKHSHAAELEDNSLQMQNNWVSVYMATISSKWELCENMLCHRDSQ